MCENSNEVVCTKVHRNEQYLEHYTVYATLKHDTRAKKCAEICTKSA